MVTYHPPGLEGWDIVVVVLYFVVILGVGFFAMFKSNRSTVSGYFLAGRFMTWLPVGASLFASNIGSEHFIGLAGSGAAAGIGVGAFEFNALILLQFLGWVFIPVYIAGGVCTLPEYLHRRYGGQRIRIWLSVLSLLLYIFTKISVNLFSGALFIRLALGWNLYLAILLLLFMTFLCTVTGGLAAVIYTDTLCTFLMSVGSLTVMGMGFAEIGGYSGLKEKYMLAVSNDTLYSNSTCGRPRPDSFTMLREPLHSDMPWAGFIFGQTIASIWYWCADQVIVQRALAAKSLSHAQGGCLLAGYIKILPLFTLVMPGMISRVLSPDRVACSVPEKCMEICGSEVGCTNIAYPELVLKLMPTGLRGLMMAVMMAALMSDLTSIFNSASTLFTIDVYGLFRKKASVRELMIVGRVMVAIMTIIGILWIPVVQNVQGGQLFIYIQAVSAHFSPPIACLYLISIFWTKATEKGAFWGMMMGFVIGVIRMVLDFTYQAPKCGESDQRPAITKDLHYMYFALVLFWITGIAIVVISLFTKPSEGANTSRLTWWTRYDSPAESKYSGETGKGKEVLLDDINKSVKLTKMTYRDENNDAEKENKEEKGEKEDSLIDQEKALGSDERKSDIVIIDAKRSPIRRFYNWFCGYETGSEEAVKAAIEQEQRISIVTSLEQDPRAKIFLQVNVAIILCIGLALYIYFSV
ncbi:sodium/myo-inositol cotransporter-like [Actinia tenebrosa]|uniref:Sodium/myo-inositol cotransporter n=1 Tax=Actinia tenebrosa TaxID=6105 RepID=A0A6P8HCT2_ACTTE|nr:sodium/myo-inositol cotransporter-like [Actinia tenebrosa]